MRTKEEYQRALDFMQGKNICASCGSSNCDKCLNVIYKNMLQELIDNYHTVTYLCDKEKCDNCSADRADGCSCKHTLDIKHAQNFKRIEETNDYEEMESTKETPMKVKGIYCPNCCNRKYDIDERLNDQPDYCDVCGQKLDWSYYGKKDGN